MAIHHSTPPLGGGERPRLPSAQVGPVTQAIRAMRSGVPVENAHSQFVHGIRTLFRAEVENLVEDMDEVPLKLRAVRAKTTADSEADDLENDIRRNGGHGYTVGLLRGPAIDLLRLTQSEAVAPRADLPSLVAMR